MENAIAHEQRKMKFEKHDVQIKNEIIEMDDTSCAEFYYIQSTQNNPI